MDEEIKSKRKAKAKPVKRIKFGRLMILLILLFYFIMFVNAFFGQKIKTYVVTYGKIEELDNAYGFVVRDEKIISNNSSGVLKPVKSEGERVAKGCIIAKVFDNSVIETEKKISDVDDRIQRVIKENENNNNYIKLDFSADIKKIDYDTEEKIIELCRIDRDKDFTKIFQIKDAINENIRKKAEISGQMGQANQYLRNLINEKKALQNNMMAMKHNVFSQSAGVVSYSSDGLENILVPENVKNLTISQLEQIEMQMEQAKTETFNVVKIVDNFKCYICAVVTNKERIPKIKNNSNVWLRFSNEDEELIPGKVYNISVEKDGRALIIFSINNNVENLLNYRKVNFDIVWSTSKGLKIPLSAIKKGKFIDIDIQDKQEVQKVTEGDRISLKIAGHNDKSYSGIVYDILKKPDGEGYTIDLMLTNQVEGLTSGKKVDIQVNWLGIKSMDMPRGFSGVCLEKDGVMTVNTSYASFQEANILKKDKEYAIVKEASSMFEKGITLYEEILLNGSNVEEGRQIRRWDL